MSDAQTPPEWTKNPTTGTYYLSDAWIRLVDAVEEIIQEDTHRIYRPDYIRSLARLILLELVTTHGLAPAAEKESESAARTELAHIDAILARRDALDGLRDRGSKILAAVERAGEADRHERNWRSLLNAEQVLSRSYVRIREIVGSINEPQPDVWNEETAKQHGIPVEYVDGKPQLGWAWTERQAKRHRDQVSRDAQLRLAIDSLLGHPPKSTRDRVHVHCAVCGHTEMGHHAYVSHIFYTPHPFEPAQPQTPEEEGPTL